MTATDTTTTTQPEGTVTPITATTPARATWKQHGSPLSGFEFYGTMVKTPNAEGVKVAKVVQDDQGRITLKKANGRSFNGAEFAAGTKFWAVVPADAPRKVEEPKPMKPSTPAVPLVITAPKGGTQTVAPVKGAIAKAITASGKSIMAISREHGLNPSQLRRLVNDSVAKVDLTRAEAIAKALGVSLDSLFGGAQTKAKAEPKTAPKAPATAG